MSRNLYVLLLDTQIEGKGKFTWRANGEIFTSIIKEVDKLMFIFKGWRKIESINL